MSSIAIVYRKDKLNKKKKAPIHFRLIQNRKPKYISSKVMLEQRHWDFKKNKVKSTFKNSARLNNFLTTQLAEFQSKLLEAETYTSTKSAKELREVLAGDNITDFFSFSYSFIKLYLANDQVGTYDKCKSILDKFKTFAKSNSLAFSKITPSYLYEFEIYLREKRKNKANTINSNMKFIARIFNAAFAKGVLEYKDNPFLIYKKPKPEKTIKEYLTEKEISAFENIEVKSDTLLAIHKDIFIFSCYGGGERISDLLTLKWKDFDGSYIHFATNKTETQLSILLPNRSLDILNMYKEKIKKSSVFIFPILTDSLDLKNSREVDSAISSATALMNKNLKKLAKKAGIDKNITTHTTRHTWATRALRKGISIDKVSKILGHTNIKQTQLYAKIVSSELDKAMQVFNN